MANTRHHVALLVPASRAYGRGICQGVATYALEREDWLIFPGERWDAVDVPTWLKKGNVDGIIAYISSRDLGRQLMALDVPIVDVQGEGSCPELPILDTDPEATARLAADFFSEAGFVHFAFCGYPGIFFSDRRTEAFKRILQERGMSAEVYSPPARAMASMIRQHRERSALEFEPELSAWLAQIPKPVAILACNDIRGQQVINACRALGIAMPSDVSVMGVDNDEIICRLCRPTLSSIAPDSERIGRMAGEMLTSMMDGEKVRPGVHMIAPLRVIERQSTDITTAQDPVTLAASRIIRDRACRGISVEQVCDLVHCSRSTLDNLFKKHLGRPVAQEIQRVRLSRAMRLLEDTDLVLEEVAQKCGFLSASYFCRFFKRETGISPSHFRSGRQGR